MSKPHPGLTRCSKSGKPPVFHREGIPQRKCYSILWGIQQLEPIPGKMWGVSHVASGQDEFWCLQVADKMILVSWIFWIVGDGNSQNNKFLLSTSKAHTQHYAFDAPWCHLQSMHSSYLGTEQLVIGVGLEFWDPAAWNGHHPKTWEVNLRKNLDILSCWVFLLLGPLFNRTTHDKTDMAARKWKDLSKIASISGWKAILC